MTPRIRSVLLAIVATVISAATVAAGPSYRIEVDGLACPFCAYGIEKQLNKINGVEKVETDIKAGAVTVTMRAGRILEKSRAAQAVDKAGFTLGGFERLGAAADGNTE